MKHSKAIFICTIIGLLFGCSNPTLERSSFEVGPATVAVKLSDYQEVRYVSSATGSDQAGSGTAANPWSTLIYALSQITDAAPNHRYAVLVSEGDYSRATVQMQEYVDLFGGFEPSRWQRDIFKHRTILTGSGEHRVLVGADYARLDGFVVRNGRVRGKGAGLLCKNVSPIISNNTFVANKTLIPLPWVPKYRHEIANDGGAIYGENDAAPAIENNLFVTNFTEAGRGAAIAFHKRCNGRIANNVFLNNTTGLLDPLRSSDGGAISIFDWSSPIVANNVILNNKALKKNDAGGLFVALWSSPTIHQNIFVGNECDDDAGALFVGGQEHRYDRPLDPMPAKEDFFVKITDNLFIGNRNPSQNSGAMRFTMEGRGLFSGNIVAHNSGIYFQRSEVTVENNTILDNFLFVETKAGLAAGVIRNNLIWGAFDLQTEASVTDCNIRDGYEGPGNVSRVPAFVRDGWQFTAASASYDPGRFVTNLFVANGGFKPDELVNRVVKAGDKWGVVKSNDVKDVEIWGDFSGEVLFTVLPTYRLKSD